MPPWNELLRTGRSGRMLVLLLVLLSAAVVCARLGVWQLDRAVQRGESAAAAAAAKAAVAPPEPLTQVLAPQTSFPSALVAHTVTVSGTFEPDQLLVTGRVHAGTVGVLVLSPLRVTATGAVLPVVRGWVPDLAAASDLMAPAAADGTVEVTGYLQVGEAAGTGVVPPGQIDAISPAELVNLWQGPIYSGYLVLSGVTPAQQGPITVLEPPTTASSGGLNLQSLSYALQWWIFGGFALLLWGRMVRDETQDRLAPADAAVGAAGPPDAPSSPAPSAVATSER